MDKPDRFFLNLFNFFSCRHKPVSAAPAACENPQQQAAGRPVEHKDSHGGAAADPLGGTTGILAAGCELTETGSKFMARAN
jgi:hypothetical protein